MAYRKKSFSKGKKKWKSRAKKSGPIRIGYRM